jgi:undecaprenyl-diphosphatase
MDSLQIAILALVQGLTEFLPISSSAHLILVPCLFGFTDQGLAFDVAVHVGTLIAVIAYFRGELESIARDVVHGLRPGQRPPANARLGWMIAIATLPVVGAGFLIKDAVETTLRTPLVIAATTIGFGLLLWIGDLRGTRRRDEYSIDWKDALLIGVFQSLALIPGTSRSGSTITAGLFLGMTREAASRFSFLLAIPAISLSAAFVTHELILSPETVNWGVLSLGALLSFLTAFLCIHFFLKVIERVGMWPFVLYRFALGTLILASVVW